jgi:hypothetical protein
VHRETPYVDAAGGRRLSRNRREVNAAQRRPGECATAVLKNWKILRKIRRCPNRVTTLVNAVQVLILALDRAPAKSAALLSEGGGRDFGVAQLQIDPPPWLLVRHQIPSQINRGSPRQ